MILELNENENENENIFNIKFNKILDKKHSFSKDLKLYDKVSYNYSIVINNNIKYENLTIVNIKELLFNKIIEFKSTYINKNNYLNEISFIKKGTFKIILSRKYDYLNYSNNMDIINYLIKIN